LEILGIETGENFPMVGIMNGMRDILRGRESDQSSASPCPASNVKKKHVDLFVHKNLKG